MRGKIIRVSLLDHIHLDASVAKKILNKLKSMYKGNSISKDNFVTTAQPHIVYELTSIYGFLNVSADTDENKLYIASSILA